MSTTTAPPFSPVARGRIPWAPIVKVPLIGGSLIVTAGVATWLFIVPHKVAAPTMAAVKWDAGANVKLPKLAEVDIGHPPDTAPAAAATDTAKMEAATDAAKPDAPVLHPHRMQVWGADGSNNPPPAASRAASAGPRSPSGYANANGSAIGAAQGEGGPTSEYGAQLTPTKTRGGEAEVYADDSLLLTAGTDIDCMIPSAYDNQIAGAITCIVAQDVYSHDGTNILINKWAKANGEITRGQGLGQDRGFILWTQIDSGKVHFEANSATADSLGQAGFPVQVDEHWWERIKDAAAITAIQTAGGVVQNLASKEGSTSVNLSAGQSLASQAFGRGVGIPNTGWAPGGTMLKIHIQHNVPFHRAYGNKLVAGVS